MTRPMIVAGIGEVLWDVYPDESRFGGAPANFAAHAAGLGAEACVVSAVGADAPGDLALEEMLRRNVSTSAVARNAQRPTGSVMVTLDSLGRASYQFAGDTAWDHLEWTSGLAKLASRCDAVCFGSLGQRAADSRAVIRRFLTATRRQALRVFDVNLRQDFYSAEVIRTSLELASAVKMNDDELPVVAELCGIPHHSEGGTLTALAERYDLSLAVLTRGARGSLIRMHGVMDECAAVPANVVDTVGAGDAFTAAVVTGHLLGRSPAAINRHASEVAAWICAQPGASRPLPSRFRLSAVPSEKATA